MVVYGVIKIIFVSFVVFWVLFAWRIKMVAFRKAKSYNEIFG